MATSNTKVIKEIITDVGGNTTIEYSDDTTQKYNVADVVTAQSNPLTGGISLVAGGQSVYVAPTFMRQFSDFSAKKLVWHGDSTTEQLAGMALVPYVAGRNQLFNTIPGYVTNENRGSNGMSLAALIASGPGITNAGPVLCGIEDVAAASNSANLLVWSFGINDFRTDASIAGSYGNAGMVASVAAFQAKVSTYIARFRVVCANTPILFRVPNTVAATSALITGPTGQNVTDALRIAYLGDETLGINPITALDAKSVVLDAGGIVFGNTAWTLANVPASMNADGLHPSSTGYNQIAQLISEYLSDISRDFGMMTVSRGDVVNSQASYMDLGFDYPIANLFGNGSSTSYATVSVPALGVGDTLRFLQADGSKKRIVLSAAPYQNNSGSYIRWVAGPDGSFHPEIVQGSTFTHQRPKVFSLGQLFIERLQKSGVAKTLYPFRVEAGGAGSITIRSIPNKEGLSLAVRAPTTSDLMCIAAVGVDNTPSGFGLALTGSTITANAPPGSFTITGLSGNYAACVKQFGHVVAG